eukprot:scaffold9331_cov116-Isochrysis_galbana.AAC.6
MYLHTKLRNASRSLAWAEAEMNSVGMRIRLKLKLAAPTPWMSAPAAPLAVSAIVVRAKRTFCTSDSSIEHADCTGNEAEGAPGG